LENLDFFLENRLCENWHLKSLDRRSNAAVSYHDTESVEELHMHPMLGRAPKIKSLLAFAIPKIDSDSIAVLMVANPQIAVLADSDLMTALLLLARILGGTIDQIIDSPNYDSSSFAGNTFAEGGEPPKFDEDQTAAAFLLKTLVTKHRLLTRNGVSYVGLRSWRASIKPFQIAALTALKADIPKPFVMASASEVADAAISHLGALFIQNVIPVPCGSSARADCLSVQIAEEVARLLSCEFMNVLRSQVPRGSSHPKASAKLRSISMEGACKGAALVVDDLTTSGKHIELAVRCLRENGINCFAIGWIAN
jgi:hypothetical protein